MDWGLRFERIDIEILDLSRKLKQNFVQKYLNNFNQVNVILTQQVVPIITQQIIQPVITQNIVQGVFTQQLVQTVPVLTQQQIIQPIITQQVVQSVPVLTQQQIMQPDDQVKPDNNFVVPKASNMQEDQPPPYVGPTEISM